MDDPETYGVGPEEESVSNRMIRLMVNGKENSRHAHRETIDHAFVVKWLDVSAYGRMVNTRIRITLETGQLVLANVHHFSFFANLVGIIIKKRKEKKR